MLLKLGLHIVRHANSNMTLYQLQSHECSQVLQACRTQLETKPNNNLIMYQTVLTQTKLCKYVRKVELK